MPEESVVEIEPVDRLIPHEEIQTPENKDINSTLNEEEKAKFQKIEEVSSWLENPKLAFVPRDPLSQGDFVQLLHEYNSDKELLGKLMSDNMERSGYGPVNNQHGRGDTHVLEILNNYFVYIKTHSDLSFMQNGSPIKNDMNSFLDFGTELLHKNLNKIEEIATGDGINDLDTRLAMDSVANLARVSNNDEIKKEAVEFLIKNFEKSTRLPGKAYYFSSALSGILECGDASQVETGKEIVIRLLKDENREIKAAAYANFVEYWTSGNIENTTIKNIASSAFSVDIDDEAVNWGEKWLKSKEDNHEISKKYLLMNLASLSSLEMERPGITNVLGSEFGIYNFARYPTELLIDQYDQINAKDNLPYGVIVYPNADHNGAFYGSNKVFKGLSDQLQGKYSIKTYEAKDSLGLVSAINNARHRYGKISFAVIGGHGSEDHVQFGGAARQFFEKKGELQQKDVLRKGASSLQLAFVENPTIILDSCSTGSMGGIGEEISKLGANVIAPPVPVSPGAINVDIMPDGEITFNVKYGEKKVLPKTYQSKISSDGLENK
jgi:hypothetical protein